MLAAFDGNNERYWGRVVGWRKGASRETTSLEFRGGRRGENTPVGREGEATWVGRRLGRARGGGDGPLRGAACLGSSSFVPTNTLMLR